MSVGLQQQILISYDKSYDKNAPWVNICEDCAKTYDKPILKTIKNVKIIGIISRTVNEVCSESLLRKRECFFWSFPEPMC